MFRHFPLLYTHTAATHIYTVSQYADLLFLQQLGDALNVRRHEAILVPWPAHRHRRLQLYHGHGPTLTTALCVCACVRVCVSVYALTSYPSTHYVFILDAYVQSPTKSP